MRQFESVRDSVGGKKPNLRLKCVDKPLGNVLQRKEQQRLLSSAKSVSVDAGREPGRAEPIEQGQRIPESQTPSETHVARRIALRHDALERKNLLLFLRRGENRIVLQRRESEPSKILH